MTDLPLFLPDPEAATALAQAIAPMLRAGDTILLSGPVGAGKSHVARALIAARLAALGRREDIPSPTFTLVQSYDLGTVEIWHADLYRLSGPDEVVELGLPEAFDTAICLVEWPARLDDLTPPEALHLTLAHRPDGAGRDARLSGPARWAPVIEAAAEAVRRAGEITDLLAPTDFAGAERAPLAGDASARRYLRLTRDDGATAILMDAPPDRCGPPDSFLRMTDWLRARGYSAPEVLAADPAKGLILLEDLGDAVLARELADDLGQEAAAYRGLAALLADLHRHAPPEGLTRLDAPELGRMTRIAVDWYSRAAAGQPPAEGTPAADALDAAVAQAAARLVTGPMVLALRDFHAENIVLLPGRAGLARFGLLDYQDAVAAHPAYDLVSALQDARRDVPPGVEAEARAHYAALTGADPDGFSAAYALLGAQRNLRIMGVFARLALAGGKPHYLALLPRVWGYIQRNLTHPALADLAAAVALHVPAPTPETLERIARPCHPTR